MGTSGVLRMKGDDGLDVVMVMVLWKVGWFWVEGHGAGGDEEGMARSKGLVGFYSDAIRDSNLRQ